MIAWKTGLLLWTLIYILFASLTYCTIVSPQTYIPLCQNETKLYLDWKKPASGWYYYDNRRESYLRRPPGSGWRGYYNFYEFFRSSTDGQWKLQEFSDNAFYNLKSVPYHGTNPLFINENPIKIASGLKIKNMYRHQWKTDFDHYDEEEIPAENEIKRDFSQSAFKVSCPRRCSCEMVNVHGIGSHPIVFFRSDIARHWENNCSSVLSLYYLPETLPSSTNLPEYQEDSRRNWWKPEIYLSKSCQILYYNDDYETWHADLMPSHSCSLAEFFSSDSAACIEALPYSQKWDQYVEIGVSDGSKIVQQICGRLYTMKKSASFQVTCACRCKGVYAIFMEGRQSKTVLFRRNDFFQLHQNKSNSCQFQIEQFHNINNMPISYKLAAVRSMNWKLDYYISRDCQILYQNIYDNSWVIDYYSNLKCKSRRYLGENKSKCIEKLPDSIYQQWSSNHRMVNDKEDQCQYPVSNLELLSTSCIDVEL